MSSAFNASRISIIMRSTREIWFQFDVSRQIARRNVRMHNRLKIENLGRNSAQANSYRFPWNTKWSQDTLSSSTKRSWSPIRIPSTVRENGAKGLHGQRSTRSRRDSRLLTLMRSRIQRRKANGKISVPEMTYFLSAKTVLSLSAADVTKGGMANLPSALLSRTMASGRRRTKLRWNT
jgi:hypothetical protein